MTGWLSCIFLVPMECVVVAFADTLENKCAEYSVEDVASSSCLLLLETRPALCLAAGLALARGMQQLRSYVRSSRSAAFI